MTEVGRMLEEARLRKGITLDKVEADLKIRKSYLLAMESGRWEDLPGYAYATGFLRTYGEYLGLSGDDLVEEYKYWREIQGIDTIADDTPIGVFTRAKELQTDTGIFQLSAKGQGRARRRRKTYRGLVVIIILLLALAAYVFLTWRQPFSDTKGDSMPLEQVQGEVYGELEEPEPASEAESLLKTPSFPAEGLDPEGLTVDEVPAGDMEQAIGLGETHEPEVDATIHPEGEERVIEPESLAEAPIPPTADVTGVEVQVTLPEDVVHRLPPVEVEGDRWPLTVEAIVTGRCWVEVRGDGELLASRTLEAGEHHIWNALEEIKIRFGNAGVVELKLNGRELGPAGKGVLTRVFTLEMVQQD
ncbi:MAG: helix-turn-helix domain-containing protein [Firmicutes bacterium]|nr:helix-turn-helix domain-containing protein [Bacillota bacterium]